MTRVFAWILTAIGFALAACNSEPSMTPGAGQATGVPSDYERGPHRGRLLRAGEFALELQIYEDGVPPQFRVYLYRAGQPLPPTAAAVTVELTRLGDKIDRFAFSPRGEFLLGDSVVYEPHSFSVAVTARENGQVHRWNYDSFEGRTRIPTAIAREAGIGVEVAGPATIVETLALTGRIVANAERVRTVSARFPGVIRSVGKSAGEQVARGETLAQIESNDSLRTYAVAAPIAGVILERGANPGEVAGTEPLFVIADQRSVWAELTLFPRDLARVHVGKDVRVVGVDSHAQGAGRIVRIAPVDEGPPRGLSSGLYHARVVLDNPDGRWMPGLFVQAHVDIAQFPVALAVKRSGLQAFRDFTVVFEQIGEDYEVRMLELGRQDDTWVEVLGGLAAGARYVAMNSYLIKADVEKSGASHDH